MTGMSRTGSIRLPLLEALLGLGAALILVAGLRDGHHFVSRLDWLLAVLALLVTAAAIEFIRRRAVSAGVAAVRTRAIDTGLALGLLWTAEILANNVLAPPLPGRDIFDNVIWAIISLGIVGLAAFDVRRSRSMRTAIATGAWAGLASGLVACLTAICVAVFGTPLLTADPLNVAEWAARSGSTAAPSMAEYFATQTLAGAIGHLLLIGLVMGSALGAVGGLAGLAGRRLSRDAPSRT